MNFYHINDSTEWILFLGDHWYQVTTKKFRRRMKENIDGNLHLNHSLYDVIDEILDEIENIPYHSINRIIADLCLEIKFIDRRQTCPSARLSKAFFSSGPRFSNI